ncbi:MAG: 30S ribosomal protein S20 [Candidatus Gottesmanbacteria bacterium]|nr:30S ribosomal protein S20 [Candidatus Gottesmanbacteria bacterium]
MPITKQAVKKLRRDRSVETHNAKIRAGMRDAVKSMRRHPTVKALSLAFGRLDKAAKNNIVHKNKAARLKSRLSRLLKKS